MHSCDVLRRVVSSYFAEDCGYDPISSVHNSFGIHCSVLIFQGQLTASRERDRLSKSVVRASEVIRGFWLASAMEKACTRYVITVLNRLRGAISK